MEKLYVVDGEKYYWIDSRWYDANFNAITDREEIQDLYKCINWENRRPLLFGTSGSGSIDVSGKANLYTTTGTISLQDVKVGDDISGKLLRFPTNIPNPTSSINCKIEFNSGYTIEVAKMIEDNTPVFALFNPEGELVIEFYNFKSRIWRISAYVIPQDCTEVTSTNLDEDITDFTKLTTLEAEVTIDVEQTYNTLKQLEERLKVLEERT